MIRWESDPGATRRGALTTNTWEYAGALVRRQRLETMARTSLSV